MQELWMDGNQLEMRGEQTWNELLERLEEECFSAGGIVLSVVMDGEEIEDFRSEQALARPIHELTRVDVVSADIEAFSRELIADAPSHVDRVARVLANTVSYYRQDLPKEAAKQLHVALDGYDMLLKLVSSAANIWGEKVDTLPDAAAMSESSLASLQQAFAALVAAQEKGELSEIARLVDEELIPSLQPWGSLFTDLNARIDSETAPVADPS